MGEPSPEGRGQAEDRLNSWKEIAAYFKRDVTTVQRWEKREGMPVHRHVHDRMSSVYASRAELDAWTRERALPSALETGDSDGPLNSALDPSRPSSPASGRKWLHLSALAVILAAVATAMSFWLQRSEYFWRSPIANARFKAIADFGGVAQAAAISRDGRFVAFLSNQEGRMDVWMTQVGSGEFHNLTKGGVAELVNPSVRTLAFSPDGSLVTFWVRKGEGANGGDISIWAAPTLGGPLRPYLEGAAELDWSPDGSRLAYHTAGPGDPLFVSEASRPLEGKLIITAPSGLHSHFPIWAPDGAFLYFVQGSLPDKMDIWRIAPSTGIPEQITSHMGRVSYPVLINRRTLMYLAGNPDGSGPSLYSMDVERRIPHRLTSGFDRYTSLAASADGTSAVATVEIPKRTIWRLPIADSTLPVRAATQISTGANLVHSPRLGPDYQMYVSDTGTGESIWKISKGMASVLWSGQDAQVIGGPSISLDGHEIAFSAEQGGKTSLFAMHDDGTGRRIVADSLRFVGDPAWAPDGQSITIAVQERGVPRLFRFPMNGRSFAPFVNEYSIDPAWAPDGRFIVYSGPDIGTTFGVKAATAEAANYPLPALTLSRGARRLRFMPRGQKLVVLRGEIKHKNLWLVDLETGNEQQLTSFPPDFDISDFDLSADGREAIVERVQERSNVGLLYLSSR
jgi:Tol biopolymer transport system component